MMERETREFTTPGNHNIVLRSYLTGREANELKSVLYADLKISAEDLQGGKVAIENIPASFIVRQEEKAITTLVVSVDGIADNAAEIVLNLPAQEYSAVVAEVNKIRNPSTPEKSEQPGAGTSQTA